MRTKVPLLLCVAAVALDVSSTFLMKGLPSALSSASNWLLAFAFGACLPLLFKQWFRNGGE